MRRHTIDIVFSLSLFMVFVLCSFLLLLFQINGYHELQYDSNNLYTASSFLQTELRSHDQANNISVKEIDGTFTLVLEEEQEVVYLYVYDGELRELYQSKAEEVDLRLGEKRFACERMEITQKQDTVFMTLYKDNDQLHLSYQQRSGGMDQ